jgi:hypothetical protein
VRGRICASSLLYRRRPTGSRRSSPILTILGNHATPALVAAGFSRAPSRYTPLESPKNPRVTARTVETQVSAFIVAAAKFSSV